LAAIVLAVGLSSVAVPGAKLAKTSLSKSDRTRWRAVLKWPDDCESGFALREGDDAGLRFHALGGRRYFVEVACAPGAWQGSQIYYFLDERASPAAARPVEFATWEAGGPAGETLVRRRATELFGNTEYAAAGRELKVVNRYRGSGDCGSYAVYRISAGKAELKEFRAKVKCDGEGADEMDGWPKVYGK
jgi:hypothetical protein